MFKNIEKIPNIINSENLNIYFILFIKSTAK